MKIEPMKIPEKYFHVIKFLLINAVTTQRITIGISTPISGVRKMLVRISPVLRLFRADFFSTPVSPLLVI